MEVREIAGPNGPLKQLVPTVWRADESTICILLDNPRTGHWLVLTLNLEGDFVSESSTANRREVA